MRIVYLTIAKFNKRDYFRFGVDYFTSKGVQVEVWNISKLIFQEYHEDYIPPDYLKSDNYIEFESYMELNAKMLILTKSDFLIDFNGQYHNSELINLNGITNVIKVVINNKPSKHDNLYVAYFVKILIAFLNFKVFRWVSFFRNSTAKKYDGVILGGFLSYSLLKIAELKLPIHTIKTHALDYDVYLTQKNSNTRVLDDEYCVFLDEAVVNHPDLKSFGVLGSMKLCDTQTYYEELNAFMDFVEDIFKIKVVISAHPRVSYLNENVFKQREVFYGHSNELIRNAKFVFGHTSNSMHYAVLYQKCILFLDSNSYDSKFRNIIKKKSMILNAQCFDISESIHQIEIRHDEKSYHRFIENYIKEKSSNNINSWEILYNDFKKIKKS